MAILWTESRFSLLTTLTLPPAWDGKKLGGKTAWNSWPKLAIPCNIMFNNKDWDRGRRVRGIASKCADAWSKSGQQSASRRSFIWFLPSFPHLLICLYPRNALFSLIFLVLSSSLLGGESEWVPVWVPGCWLGANSLDKAM